MQSVLGWTAVGGSSGLYVRVDDYSVQLSSATSSTFFVRVQKSKLRGQVLISDFNLSPTETQIGSNAILMLAREHDIDFTEKFLRVRVPSSRPLHENADSPVVDWSKTALISITEGLRQLGVSVIDHGLETDQDGQTELILHTGGR